MGIGDDGLYGRDGEGGWTGRTDIKNMGKPSVEKACP